MNCSALMDKVYESLGEEPLSNWDQVRLTVHLFFCPRCTEEYKNLKAAQNTMQTGFFPPSPDFEDALMARILDEEPELEISDAPAGFSFRSWVVIGLIVLVTLSTAFFGSDFTKIADAQGSSFLLPVGLTIGAVLTGYGAFFIASHLKELSSRFGLR
ncbi:hypothetical protein AGMMS49928_19520 [Spirochaetia bacterium]|nr:hypothetical protein AGMMS49928_19520 [Spirochaetia bacterium]